MATRNKARKKASKTGRSITVYMSEEMADNLEELRRETGLSRSSLVNEVVQGRISELHEEKKKPTVLSIMSFKGGVGKTTTAGDLAICLGEFGHRVLLIDLDGQGNLSQYLGVYDPEAEKPDIADVMLTPSKGNRLALSDVIVPTIYKNVEIVPSSFRFSGADSRLKQESVNIDQRLKIAIEDHISEVDYDFIIIDCPPSLELVVTNAITALEAGSPRSLIVIPIRPDGFSIVGMKDTIEMIQTVCRERRRRDVDFRLLWTIIEERTNVFKYARNIVAEEFPNVPFLSTQIKKATAAAEATLAREPVSVYAPNSEPAQGYRALAMEVEEIVYG